MSILVTGTVALDTVETPFGKITDGLGGSATYFALAASFFTEVHITAVVGDDFPHEHIARLMAKNIDVSGIERQKGGKTFRWVGKYGFDLNNAQTLATRLNVLETFAPMVPDASRVLPHLFLANIDPVLQQRVIDQVGKPKLIGCDTMNFWIEGKRDELLKTLKRVDLLTINEGEARLLSKNPNLRKAAAIIREMGPRILVIKQGEYGALLFFEDHVFSAPGLPLEEIRDPTGAGDSFAGGLMGYLARTGNLSLEGFKQAVICGSVMASFNVEEFSCDRLGQIDHAAIRKRYEEFRHLSHFEEIDI